MNVDRHLLHYRRLGGLFFTLSRFDTTPSVLRPSHVTHLLYGFFFSFIFPLKTRRMLICFRSTYFGDFPLYPSALRSPSFGMIPSLLAHVFRFVMNAVPLFFIFSSSLCLLTICLAHSLSLAIDIFCFTVSHLDTTNSCQPTIYVSNNSRLSSYFPTQLMR